VSDSCTSTHPAGGRFTVETPAQPHERISKIRKKNRAVAFGKALTASESGRDEFCGGSFLETHQWISLALDPLVGGDFRTRGEKLGYMYPLMSTLL